MTYHTLDKYGGLGKPIEILVLTKPYNIFDTSMQRKHKSFPSAFPGGIAVATGWEGQSRLLSTATHSIFS